VTPKGAISDEAAKKAVQAAICPDKNGTAASTPSPTAPPAPEKPKEKKPAEKPALSSGPLKAPVVEKKAVPQPPQSLADQASERSKQAVDLLKSLVKERDEELAVLRSSLEEREAKVRGLEAKIRMLEAKVSRIEIQKTFLKGCGEALAASPR
jgi:phage shock protein A